jgi:hypothetical protein
MLLPERLCIAKDLPAAKSKDNHLTSRNIVALAKDFIDVVARTEKFPPDIFADINEVLLEIFLLISLLENDKSAIQSFLRATLPAEIQTLLPAEMWCCIGDHFMDGHRREVQDLTDARSLCQSITALKRIFIMNLLDKEGQPLTKTLLKKLSAQFRRCFQQAMVKGADKTSLTRIDPISSVDWFLRRSDYEIVDIITPSSSYRCGSNTASRSETSTNVNDKMGSNSNNISGNDSSSYAAVLCSMRRERGEANVVSAAIVRDNGEVVTFSRDLGVDWETVVCASVDHETLAVLHCPTKEYQYELGCGNEEGFCLHRWNFAQCAEEHQELYRLNRRTCQDFLHMRSPFLCEKTCIQTKRLTDLDDIKWSYDNFPQPRGSSTLGDYLSSFVGKLYGRTLPKRPFLPPRIISEDFKLSLNNDGSCVITVTLQREIILIHIDKGGKTITSSLTTTAKPRLHCIKGNVAVVTLALEGPPETFLLDAQTRFKIKQRPDSHTMPLNPMAKFVFDSDEDIFVEIVGNRFRLFSFENMGRIHSTYSFLQSGELLCDTQQGNNR